jgi:hypothetical protein
VKITAKIAITFAGACLLMASPIVNAQLLKYDNQQQVYGAAAASPESTRQVLKKLIGYCSRFGDATRTAGEKAYADWESRHRDFLEENARIKQELLATARAPKATESQKNQILLMFDVMLPKAVDAQYLAFVSPIETAPDSATKTHICNSYVQSVNDGKWDLRTNDPVVSAFLDKRIAKRTEPQN